MNMSYRGDVSTFFLAMISVVDATWIVLAALPWILLYALPLVSTAIPLQKQSQACQSNNSNKTKRERMPSAIQADSLVLWTWCLQEFVPSSVVVMFAALMPWRFWCGSGGTCWGYGQPSAWLHLCDTEDFEKEINRLGWKAVTFCLPLQGLLSILDMVSKRSCERILNVMFLVGVILPNIIRIICHSRKAEQWDRYEKGLAIRRAAGMALVVFWKSLRCLSISLSFQLQFFSIVGIIFPNLTVDQDRFCQIFNDDGCNVLQSTLYTMRRFISSKAEIMLPSLLAVSVFSTLYSIAVFPIWSILALFSALPVTSSRECYKAAYVSLLLLLSLLSISVHSTMIALPLMSFLAAMAHVVSATMLVASTWIDPSAAPRRRCEGKTRMSWLYWLVSRSLGTETLSLQACLVVLAPRGMYSLVELFCPFRQYLSPATSLSLSVASVLVARPLKERMGTTTVKGFIEATVPKLIPPLESNVLALSNRTTPLVVSGGLLLGFLGGAFPRFTTCMVVLGNTVVQAVASFSTLQVVMSQRNEISESMLREWQCYWLLDAWLLSWVSLLVFSWNHWRASSLLLIFRGYTLVDRGASLPWFRRAVITMELLLHRLILTMAGKGGFGDDVHVLLILRKELLHSWDTAKDRVNIEPRSAAATTRDSDPSNQNPLQRPDPDIIDATTPAGLGGQAIKKEASKLVECVCCCETVVKEQTALCPHGHSTCKACFSILFDMSLARSRDKLHPNEQKQARYMVECTSQGCGPTTHFGIKTMAKLLTEEQAVRWEQINKKLYKDLHLQEWIRQAVAKDEEQIRVEEIQDSFRGADGTYQGVYQCPKCRYGPKPLAACTDLELHHGEEVTNPRTGQVYRRNNACEKCGWFGRIVSMWDPWDGTVWPAKTLPERTTSTNSASPRQPPRQQSSRLLQSMGYSADVVNQLRVRRAIQRAVIDGADVEGQVIAAINVLERQGRSGWNDEPQTPAETGMRHGRQWYRVPLRLRRRVSTAETIGSFT